MCVANMNLSRAIFVLVAIIVASVVAYQLMGTDAPSPVPPQAASEEPAGAQNAIVDSESDDVAPDEVAEPGASLVPDGFLEQFPDPIEVLRERGLDTSEAGIRAMLADTNRPSGARHWGAMALGKLNSAGAYEILAQLLKNETDNDVRIGAVGGLAYLGDSESISLLESYLAHDPDESVRVAVLSALYRNPSEMGREVFSRTAVDTTQHLPVRVSALEGTALVQSEAVANTMRTLLIDTEPEIRARAAVALSRTHQNEALSYLVDSALDDDIPLHVWGRVVRRLQEVTDDQFTDHKPVDYAADPELRASTKKEIARWWSDSHSN